MRFHSRAGLGLCFLAIAEAPTLLAGQSPAPPSLASADSFAVLGGSSVTSTGPSVVTGNLGVSPGTTISGSIAVKVGVAYRNDSVARQAQRDATSAYNDLAGRTCTTVSSTGFDGSPLGPGVYCFSSSAQLSGTLILDAANDPNAVWIFKFATTLSTAAGSSVRVINSGYENNVFWHIGDSITLGAGTTFLGNVLAHNDITLHSGANVSGRLLAQGVVSLAGNNVSLCCGHITLSPETLPNGVQGTPFGPFTITAGGGLEPYVFTPSSPFPGITLSPGGVLSGTPTTAGPVTFTIIATDSTHVCSGSRTYTIDIVCPETTAISPSATPPAPSVPFVLPPATACIPYTLKFGDGCTLPHNFVLTPTGPAGGPVPSELNPTTGVLQWTPKKSGAYTFTVSDGKFSQLYTIVVSCEAISISPLALPDGEVCAQYNQPITAAGCDPPYVLSLEPGSRLPPGLDLIGNAIRGTPAKVGSYSFTIRAADNDDPACFVIRDYTLNIICPPITISPDPLPPAACQQQYCVQLSPSCAAGKPAFEAPATDLPPGLILSPNGMLCGTPSAPGTYRFTVTFTDGDSGCTGSVNYTLTVTGVTITPPALPGGSPGVPYSEVLTASGGVAPYAFTESGPLPAGLTFMQTTPTTATITGIPTSAGCSAFIVTVTDANGVNICTPITYTICIAAGGPTLSSWGLMVLSILLAGAGILMIRRGA
ncbi:MAG: IPTL-CTERM sorting domain-containing protein [Acidobacteria bacterium]|nr:IPTL-CTERM sorting domain-containing protein [Acidobacteriota bacterium]